MIYRKISQAKCLYKYSTNIKNQYSFLAQPITNTAGYLQAHSSEESRKLYFLTK